MTKVCGSVSLLELCALVQTLPNTADAQLLHPGGRCSSGSTTGVSTTKNGARSAQPAARICIEPAQLSVMQHSTMPMQDVPLGPNTCCTSDCIKPHSRGEALQAWR